MGTPIFDPGFGKNRKFYVQNDFENFLYDLQRSNTDQMSKNGCRAVFLSDYGFLGLTSVGGTLKCKCDAL